MRGEDALFLWTLREYVTMIVVALRKIHILITLLALSIFGCNKIQFQQNHQ